MDVWRVDPEKSIDTIQSQLAEPAQRLRAGEVVAFPTETVYGLGANALDDAAVQKIFRAKGRPSDNPLIVHIADMSQLEQVVRSPEDIPETAKRLMQTFWPGPLTIILPANANLAPSVHPGMDTVGLRMPKHPIALALIRAAGCPLAAPSANTSGRPSPTNAETVIHDLSDQISGIVDGGACDVGLESTVVAVDHAAGVVYRPGWITPDELAAAARVSFTLDAHLKDAAEKPKSPGMKYRHYAPDAEVSVWYGKTASVAEAIREFAGSHREERMALICPPNFPKVEGIAVRWSPNQVGGSSASDDASNPDSERRDSSEPLGATGVGAGPCTPDSYVEALSRELYSRLRWADEVEVHYVLIVGVEPVGRGLALMNRLQKASEGRLYRL
jgi:L-threonylcarbamoyladenylate synthase